MSRAEELIARYEKQVEATWRRMTRKSREFAERAERFVPGGALRSHPTGTYPAYGERVDACYQYDVDGNRYLDLVLGMTSIIGHNHPKVARALEEQIPKGLVSFMPEVARDELAETMCNRVPSIEKVWFTLGGSQSFMWAIRAARAFTGREKILKMRGGYNGTYDDTIAIPPNDLYPNGLPGLPRNTMDNVLLTHWNDKEGTERVIRENKDDLAAVITEGVQTGGTILPQNGYLTFLREITSRYGIVLIFDEIVNFWLSHGGTGHLHSVDPDLSCYGKGIGGGLPMGLIGGRSDIMKLFSQAEQFRVAAIAAHTGDPMSVAASTACLDIMTVDEIARINALGESMADGIRSILEEMQIRGHVVGYGNHQSVHFTATDAFVDPVAYLQSANRPGFKEVMALFRRSLINKGVRTLENLMALRISVPVSETEIEIALVAMREGFAEVRPLLKEVAPDLVG